MLNKSDYLKLQIITKESVLRKYDKVDNFHNGLALVKKNGRNGKYGFINTEGEEVISCQYRYFFHHYLL